MIDPRSFAAHLAAVARAPDPEDRAATDLVDAVLRDWTELALSPDPRFELDAGTFSVGGHACGLPSPLREALRGLDGALRAHGVGGVRVAGAVDRGAVLALLRCPRALPSSSTREELQRWLAANGGGALQLLPDRPPSPPDSRGALTGIARTWTEFAAAADAGPSPALGAAARALLDRVEADPSALPAVLAFAGPRPARRAACVAGWSVLVGRRLGLERGALLDLLRCAVAVAALPPSPDADSVTDALVERLSARPSLADARAVATLWGIAPGGPRHPHLFARIVALAEELDALLRAEGARRPAAEAAVALFQSQAGRRREPALTHALFASIGRWPVGTLALLDTGELVVVCRGPANPEHPTRPTVRVVVDRAGVLLVGTPLVDLARPDRLHSRIVGSVDPTRFGIDIAAAVLG